MDERVATCQDLLNMINGDKNFLAKVITIDGSWCFAYDPETKPQSSRFQKSKVKTMLIVFFDSQGKRFALLMQNIIKVCYTA